MKNKGLKTITLYKLLGFNQTRLKNKYNIRYLV